MAHNMLVPVFMGEGRLEMQERPTPQVKNWDDVLLRVEACGLCGTDLNILAVPPAHIAEVGIVLGHECIGTVEGVGAGVKYVRQGDRVVVAPRLHCNQCRYCRRGLPNQCEDYKTLGVHRDGGLAPVSYTHLDVYKRQVHKMRVPGVRFYPVKSVSASWTIGMIWRKDRRELTEPFQKAVMAVRRIQ